MHTHPREEKKLLYISLVTLVPSPNPYMFYPPHPVVAGELQENIWGQRQQPTTQYSCTGKNIHTHFFSCWECNLSCVLIIITLRNPVGKSLKNETDILQN